jgi:uncharacterized protein (TIGR03118 family)
MFSFLSRLFSAPASTCRKRSSYRPQVEAYEDRLVPTNGLSLVNLVSTQPGYALRSDPSIPYPASVAVGADGQVAVVSAGTWTVELLDATGQNPTKTLQPSAIFLSAVYSGAYGFTVTENGTTAAVDYLFGTNDGRIFGYAPLIDPDHLIVIVDESAHWGFFGSFGIATDNAGDTRLYLLDRNNGVVEVFDQDFQRVSTSPGAFEAPVALTNPDPSAMVVSGDHVFGSYSGGFFFSPTTTVVEYDLDGTVEKMIDVTGYDEVVALAVAPADFGPYANDLLVGDYRTKRIGAFDIDTGAYVGPLADDNGTTILSYNFGGLAFGSDYRGGASQDLYIASGTFPNLYGLLSVVEGPFVPNVAPTPPTPSIPSIPSTLLAPPPFVPATPSPSPGATLAPVVAPHDSSPSPSFSPPAVESPPSWNPQGPSGDATPPTPPPAPVPTPSDPLPPSVPDRTPTSAVIGPDVLPPMGTPIGTPNTLPTDIPQLPTPGDVSRAPDEAPTTPAEQRNMNAQRLGFAPLLMAAAVPAIVQRPKRKRSRKSRKRSALKK